MSCMNRTAIAIAVTVISTLVMLMSCSSIWSLSFGLAVVSAMGCVCVYRSLMGRLSDEIEGSKTIGAVLKC